MIPTLNEPCVYVGGEIERLPLTLATLLQAEIAFEPGAGSLELSRRLAEVGDAEVRRELLRQVFPVLTLEDLVGMATCEEGLDVFRQVFGIRRGASGRDLAEECGRMEEACRVAGRKCFGGDGWRARTRGEADVLLWEIEGKVGRSPKRLVSAVLERLACRCREDVHVGGGIAHWLLCGMRPDLLSDRHRRGIASGLLNLLAAGELPRFAHCAPGESALALAFRLVDAGRLESLDAS